ncbi:zinc finger and BTB domain-containing protein 32 isoform X1 [Notamacropus eugenii]
MPLPSVQLHSPHGVDGLVRLAASLRPALCDAVIRVGTQEFPAHSLVLAGVSKQLGRRGRWTLIEGISPPIFAHLLHFAYGETLELRPGELGPLREAAWALGAETLEVECRRVLGEERYQALKLYQEKPEEPPGGKDGSKKLKLGKPLEVWPRSRAPTQKMGEKHQQEEALVAWSETTPQGLSNSLETSESCLRRPLIPIPQPASPQGSTITKPWYWEDQSVLGGILLLSPRYGISFPHSTPFPEAWREMLPQEQRNLLSLRSPAVLWGHSPDNLRCHLSSIPCPGSLQLGTAQPSSHEKSMPEQRSCEAGGYPSPYGNHLSKAAATPQNSRPLPSGSRPYPCPACGKKFSLKHQMETHYRVHTGEKPFSCRLCPQRSRDFSAMTKHLRTHGAAPYRCPLCQAGSPSMAAMQAHIRSHPPGQLPPGWTIQSAFLYSSSRPPAPSSSHGPCTTSPSSSSPFPSPSGAT